MQNLPAELVASFERRLNKARVPQSHRPDYHKWARLYLYFRQRYNFPPTAPTALGPFLTKLAAKGYFIDQRHHAATAVRLLIRADPQDPNFYLQLSALCASDLHPSQAAAQPAAGSPPAPNPLTASWEQCVRTLALHLNI